MITTQLKKLDKILGGGIKNAIITDIFGQEYSTTARWTDYKNTCQ